MLCGVINGYRRKIEKGVKSGEVHPIPRPLQLRGLRKYGSLMMVWSLHRSRLLVYYLAGVTCRNYGIELHYFRECLSDIVDITSAAKHTYQRWSFPIQLVGQLPHQLPFLPHQSIFCSNLKWFELWRDLDEHTPSCAHNREDWVCEDTTLTPQPDKRSMFNNKAAFQFHPTRYTTCWILEPKNAQQNNMQAFLNFQLILKQKYYDNS